MKIIQIHVKMTQHTIKTSRMHFKKIAGGAKHMRRVDEVFVQQSNTIFKRVHISVENKNGSYIPNIRNWELFIPHLF